MMILRTGLPDHKQSNPTQSDHPIRRSEIHMLFHSFQGVASSPLEEDINYCNSCSSSCNRKVGADNY